MLKNVLYIIIIYTDGMTMDMCLCMLLAVIFWYAIGWTYASCEVHLCGCHAVIHIFVSLFVPCIITTLMVSIIENWLKY